LKKQALAWCCIALLQVFAKSQALQQSFGLP
jgi:hypothetical protein